MGPLRSWLTSCPANWYALLRYKLCFISFLCLRNVPFRSSFHLTDISFCFPIGFQRSSISSPSKSNIIDEFSRLGSEGKPVSAKLKTGGLTWTGDLPPFNSTMYPFPNNQPYPKTTATLSIIPSAIHLEGVVCVSSRWNGAVCA